MYHVAGNYLFHLYNNYQDNKIETQSKTMIIKTTFDFPMFVQYGITGYGQRFKTRDTKLERFLHKNQHTQRKLLNFENWTNGEPQ